MTAAFDANIFVSALAIPGGQAQRAIDLVIDARVDLCISREIIHEVLRVLGQKFSRGVQELSRAAVFLSELAELVVPRRKLAILGDKPDNRILECAVTGRADIIVTGNRAMQELQKYQGIRILSLRQFLDECAESPRQRLTEATKAASAHRWTTDLVRPPGSGARAFGHCTQLLRV